MGFRLSDATAMVDRLLGGRPEMKDLIMDQAFPAVTFPPDPAPEDASHRAPGARPVRPDLRRPGRPGEVLPRGATPARWPRRLPEPGRPKHRGRNRAP